MKKVDALIRQLWLTINSIPTDEVTEEDLKVIRALNDHPAVKKCLDNRAVSKEGLAKQANKLVKEIWG